jgi:hypothetical protein
VSDALYCANHPNIETYLRCNKCEKPICTKCAVRTPVGYRCRDCVRDQQKVFYAEFGPTKYLVVTAVSLPLALIAGWLVPALGWFAIVLGPLAGGLIAQLAHWAVRRQRGRYVWLVVCASIVVGALPTLLGGVLGFASLFLSPSGGRYYSGAGLWSLLWLGVYLVTAVGAAYAWLRPGRRV